MLQNYKNRSDRRPGEPTFPILYQVKPKTIITETIIIKDKHNKQKNITKVNSLSGQTKDNHNQRLTQPNTILYQAEMEKAYKIARMNILAQKIAQKRVFHDIFQFAPKQRKFP